MRKLVYVLAALGILTAVWYLMPRPQGGRVLLIFRFAPRKSPAYYEAAETALVAWLGGEGFKKVSGPTPSEPGDVELKYEADRTPCPVFLVKAEMTGELVCCVDYAYGGYGWSEGPDPPKARAFVERLRAWKDAYLVRNP